MVCQCLELGFLQGGRSWGRYPRLLRYSCAQNNWQRRKIELKNIENRVAWFLAELCKAQKGVQKDKRNQRRTEVVRGCLAPRVKYMGNGGVVTDQAKNNKARNIIERRLALSC
jgi:hypothetical protein